MKTPTLAPVVAVAAVAVLAASAGIASAYVPFSRADPNRDGYVTYDEAVRVFPRLQPVQFRKNDPNGDGIITQREYPLLDQFYWTTYKSSR
jgi:hypothetical protein